MNPSALSGFVLLGALLTLVCVSQYSWISVSSPLASEIPIYFFGEVTPIVLNQNTLVFPGNNASVSVNSSEEALAAEVISSEEAEDGLAASTLQGSESSEVTPIVLTQNTRIFPGDNASVSVTSSEEALPGEMISSEEAEDGLAASTLQGSESLDDSECDLYHGQWYYDDSVEPLYSSKSCPIITPGHDCQSNGRPDRKYENWRWKPTQCELPRFNATKFLDLMSGRTLAIVGDSVARNQMESLICSLWQVEVPEDRRNNGMQRWIFRSKSVTIFRIWSLFLVNHTTEAFSYAPKGAPKVFLDIPDKTFMQLLPSFDVVVFNNGHQFVKSAVYMERNQIVGTQMWSSMQEREPLNISSSEAFRMATETALTATVTHPNYYGLTILVSYSPDHYQHGARDTVGSCTGKVGPLLPGQIVENNGTKLMYDGQLAAFYQAIKKQTNQSKLKLMDTTNAFSYRQEGHPGLYRSTDPNKITEQGPDGRPPTEDCLHWCMPGPVDAWNDMMLEIIRREFEGVEDYRIRDYQILE